MQDQTTSTPPATDIISPSATGITPDDIASRGIQPSIEQLPYHTPPAQVEQEVAIAQNVNLAGPIVPSSEPTQDKKQSTHPTSKAVAIMAASILICACLLIGIGVHHKL